MHTEFAYFKDICLKCLLFSHLSSPPLRSGSRALVVKDASLDWSSSRMEHLGRKLPVKYVTARLVYTFVVWVIDELGQMAGFFFRVQVSRRNRDQ